ncbi:S8 family serine peptidase [Flavihumibacter sp. RY-1]|uniref:S8 family serine peptidase n=1 Tax=Flavihumibacter fluminis TaxID=2909236 RepID=A0ABS9BNG5_9BACT|nr:S8 family serine peptidase [Flavihumibacter fluminis]MCF1716764.1 S8 family serine peptidase [Flavihumibacter fluminis]
MKTTCSLLLFLVLTLHIQAQEEIHIPGTERLLDSATSGQFFLLESSTVPPDVLILRRLSPTRFIVRYRDEIPKSKQNIPKLRPVNDLWKLSPDLLADYPANTIGRQELELIIRATSAAELKGLEQEGKLRILRTNAAWSTFVVRMNPSRLPELLKSPGIEQVSRYRKPTTERELTGFDLSANKLNAAHFWYPELSGRNQVISIKESKPDTTDIDFKGRWLPSINAAPEMETHATNMATIAAGGGNTYYTGKGAAWGAGIRSADFAELMPDATSLLKSQGVTVQNHSYGVGIENFYGLDAAAYDQQLNEDTSLLHVFSAGNRGTETSPDGPYAGITGWANLTGSFKMSKNSLVVGAMDSLQRVVPLSSRGPAHDGRIKPELIAFGEDGSSGAAALVSGTTLLLQELYQNMHSRPAPSALLRAVLVTSTDEVNAPGPDFQSGYGALNAVKAIELLQKGQYTLAGITENAVLRFSIEVPEQTATCKITLAWNDPAATANSFPALVNDLDLRVMDPNGNAILPWVLDHRATALSGNQTANRGRDSLNNLEQISIALPTAGIYTIEIRAGDLTTTQQAFAIAWQLDSLDQLRITYPTKADILTPGNQHRLRWEINSNKTGSLFYRSGNTQWKLISNAIQPGLSNYPWSVPDSLQWVQFRFVFTDTEIVSDTITVSNETRMVTGFNCADSFLIYWAPVPKAIGYRVYRLGENYLEAFTTISDTLLIQSKQNNPFTHFSVSPLFEKEKEGRRSYAFTYQNQLTSCYIQNFLADPDGPGAAKLQLELGTTYQVATVRFQQKTSTGIETVDSITVTNNRFFTRSASARDGLNLYRAIVTLANGTSYNTEWLPVYQFSSSDFFVFPSPVRKGAPLTILSKDPEAAILVLFDMTGRPLLRKQLNATTESIATTQLSSGVYIYIITRDGVKEKTGRLIIQ